jgi:hypothetical protein
VKVFTTSTSSDIDSAITEAVSITPPSLPSIHLTPSPPPVLE